MPLGPATRERLLASVEVAGAQPRPDPVAAAG